MSEDRLDRIEEEQDRAEQSMSEVKDTLSKVQMDVHEIRVTLRERDNLMGFLKTVFVTLLSVFGIGVISVMGQIAATVYYAGQISSKLEHVTAIVGDHELRLRNHDQRINEYKKSQ